MISVDMEPSVQIIDPIDEQTILQKLEVCGRTCYKSHDKIGPGTAATFVRMLIKRGHESVLEHVNITVRFICDRGVTHELVRHRIASFSQESTRYCDYGNAPIRFISPKSHMDSAQFAVWMDAMNYATEAYNKLRDLGCMPQIARSVLPNSLKTEIVTTMNLREWRHVMRLRTSPAAHPQMREVMNKLLAQFRVCLPVIFEDIANEG